MQSGCISELNLHLLSSSESPSVEKWQAELCTNIFFTVSDSISKNGNIVPPHLEGVFLNMGEIVLHFPYFSASFIHSFILDISIAPLQVHYHSEALPTVSELTCRSATGNHE